LTYTATRQLGTLKRYSDLAGTTLIGTTGFTYDSIGQVTNLQHKDGSGTNISNFAYAYDAGRRITSETLNSGSPTTFAYDTTNQVTGDGTSTFTFDGTGNRTNTGYTTGTGNQLTSDGTWNYTFDNEGNVTQKTNISSGYYWKYSYDNLNHLTEADYYSNLNVLQQKLVFLYDVFGNRIEKDVAVGGNTTVLRFFMDGWNPGKAPGVGNENWEVWVDVSNSQLQTRYIHGDLVSQLFAREDSLGTVAWYLTDWEGSIRDLTDNTGAQQDHINYDAWGNVKSETNSAFSDRFKFQGGVFEAVVGLYNFSARWYDPTTARWFSQDPILFTAGDPNLNRFVGNNPTNATDPSGLVEKGLRTLPHPPVITPIDPAKLNQLGQRGWLHIPSSWDVEDAQEIVDAAEEKGSKITPPLDSLKMLPGAISWGRTLKNQQFDVITIQGHGYGPTNKYWEPGVSLQQPPKPRGLPKGQRFQLDHLDAATIKAIKDALKPGGYIRLITCGGQAAMDRALRTPGAWEAELQELANKLGVPVAIPSDLISSTRRGIPDLDTDTINLGKITGIRPKKGGWIIKYPQPEGK
jgi:RHS repeat-associated protein